MRRKNRKWVATAVVLYLFVMWSAYRWSVSQRLPEGDILLNLQHVAIRRQAEERARAAAKEAQTQAPAPTGEARLNAAGPAYVAARYDSRHVVFIVATDTESRFSHALLRSSGTPARVAAPAVPAAPLAGLDELWEPDQQALHFFPEIVQKTHPGEQWRLSLSPDWTVPVTIDRVIVAPMGCSLALGFLASVSPAYQGAFHESPREYFVLRRNPVESAQPASSGRVGEMPNFGRSAALEKQIEQQLNSRMKEELSGIDARLVANAASPGSTSVPLPVGDARPRLKEWLHADHALVRGEGALDYDLHAFHLTPDGAPRLFVRARWTLAGAPVFLMTAWFQADAVHPEAVPVLLWSDSTWSAALRTAEAPVSLGDRLDFQSVLNEFDADNDGWAELLIHTYDAHYSTPPNQRMSVTLGLYLYTDKGLVPLKAPLHRDLQPPQSCLDP